MCGIRPGRRFLALLAALCVADLTGSAAAEDSKRGFANDSDLQITVLNERLYLEAENIPLRRVLEAIAKAGKFKLTLKGTADQSVSQTIIDEPVSAALARILQLNGFFYVMEYQRSAAPAKTRNLVGLTIIPSSGGTSELARSDAQFDSFVQERASKDEAIDDSKAGEVGEAIEELENLLSEESEPELRAALEEALTDLSDKDPALVSRFTDFN